MERWAHFSNDGRFRFELGRRWSDGGSRICWVMLNPSIADADKDDQTVRRCVYYSQEAGFDELVIVNLFARVATKPEALFLVADPSGGERNYRTIDREVRNAEAVALAWGSTIDLLTDPPRRIHHAGFSRYHVEAYARAQGKPLLCLGLTMHGAHPRHPSRLGNDVQLVRYDEALRG